MIAQLGSGTMRRLGALAAALLSCVVVTAMASEERVDAGWWSQAQRDIAVSEYEVTWQRGVPVAGLDGAWQAPNRAHGLRTFFTTDGIRVVSRTETEPAWEWQLSSAAYGRGGSSWPIAAADLDPRGARIDYRRGTLLEWYENSPRGLKQGFVLSAPPEEVGRSTAQKPQRVGTVPPGRGRTAHPERLIHLDLALGGSLRPVISEDGLAIDFEAPGGARVIRYAELLVTDARGAMLEAWMEGYVGTGGGGIRIVIDDGGATYPITIDPLATSPAWTVLGGQAGACVGVSVATAGDVNGDGYSDVIVGAYGYDNGEAEEGAAFVYLGSPSGLASSSSWSAEGNQASAYFGGSVATAGDVNADGYSDVIIGAYYFDNGQTNEGRAFVYLGSASGLAATPMWTAESNQANAYFGCSVATAGDVNGDGYSDVVVGAYLFDNGQTDEGRAFVYHGSASGPSTAPDWTAESNDSTAYYGESVATAGDVNGDGYADLIVGSRLFGAGNAGGAFVYSGGPGGLGTSASWTANGVQGGSDFGRSVATAGDVNGDGYADVLIGAPSYDDGETDEGRVFVYHGSASGPSAVADWTVESDQASAYLGRSISTAADVNGDGYADVILGSPNFDNGQVDEGRSFVYLGSGSGLSPVPDWTAESDQTNAQLGYSVATAGDVNGDGFADVLVGAFQFDQDWTNEGRASVYLGSAAGLSATAGWAEESDQVEACLGWAVGTAGDVNGDGYADVIVSAMLYDGGQLNEGRVLVYHGAATGLSPEPAWTVESNEFGGPNFGSAVGTAGDVNGDGYSDVIVGADTYGYSRLGRAFVYHGSASGLATDPAWIVEGDQTYAYFGRSAGTAGDVNGDGYADVIIGAGSYDGAFEGAGRAYVYLGTASGLAASPAWESEGSQAWAAFGRSVGTAGDTNGDGFADVVIGAPGYDGSQSDAGRVYVFNGSAAGLTATPSWTVDGEQPAEALGDPVGTAGDVNGDGYADVIAGAAWYNTGAPYYYPDVGRACVYHGGAAGLSTIPSWTAESGQLSAHFGNSVGTAGDVNGDGYADVIVGAWLFDAGQTNEGRAYVYHGSAAGLATSPAWTADGELADAYLGHCVGTAGDVNGDGYADVIVGAYGHDNGQNDEGRALLYYGNAGPGLSLRPRQTGPAGRPIAPSGRGPEAHRFDLHLDGRTPFGRGRVGLEWEVEPFGTLFDGMGLGRLAPDADTGTGGVTLSGVTVNLSAGSLHHWRARLLYRASTTPFLQRSRWIAIPWNGWQQADLRTRQDADLSITQTDAPDPVFTGHQIDYAIVVSNGGDNAPARLVDTLPAGTVFLAADPSQGSCAYEAGIVTCELGAIDNGASATVSIGVQAPATAGPATNVATVSTLPVGLEVDPADDSSSETTDVRAVNIGDVVWLDADGDGIQDLGEATIPRVAVLLYSGTGDLLDSTETNQFGYYVFPYLTYGAAYRVRFVLPPGYAFTARDQGPDDALDSDADPVTGQTVSFSLTEFSDATHWDAGLVPACVAPDETVYIYKMTLTPDGNAYPVIHFQDPNQPSQVTGYNVYRSDTASRPEEEWPLVASDVIDMDEAEPNKQWVDTSGDVPPTGIWFYDVAAYNQRCPAEGPR